MTVLVGESGFVADDWVGVTFIAFDTLAEGKDIPDGRLAVDFPNDRDPARLARWFDRVDMIRVAFPAMGDGRGFSIARRLRALGYRGRLRAAGPLIADQARAARRVGFDEIELPDSVAVRQPEELWVSRPAPSYRDHVFSVRRNDLGNGKPLSQA